MEKHSKSKVISTPKGYQPTLFRSSLSCLRAEAFEFKLQLLTLRLFTLLLS